MDGNSMRKDFQEVQRQREEMIKRIEELRRSFGSSSISPSFDIGNEQDLNIPKPTPMSITEQYKGSTVDQIVARFRKKEIPRRHYMAFMEMAGWIPIRITRKKKDDSLYSQLDQLFL